MKLRFFRIPLDGGAPEGELNELLAAGRVAEVEKHLVTDGCTPCWAVAVTLVPGDDQPKRPRAENRGVDYKDVLPADQFAVFARLRELRKELSHQHGVATYAMATNEQLASMVRSRATTREALSRIPGIGVGRLEKYGGPFLALLGEEIPKLSEPVDAP